MFDLNGGFYPIIIHGVNQLLETGISFIQDADKLTEIFNYIDFVSFPISFYMFW